MKKSKINALETRFKATALMLMHLEILNIDEIDKGITFAHQLFDDGKYKESKKMLDLVDSIIVEILELK